MIELDATVDDATQACVLACLGWDRIPAVPVSKMVSVFGLDTVMKVARAYSYNTESAREALSYIESMAANDITIEPVARIDMSKINSTLYDIDDATKDLNNDSKFLSCLIASLNLGISDLELANALGVSGSTVAKWKNGSVIPMPIMRKPVYAKLESLIFSIAKEIL